MSALSFESPSGDQPFERLLDLFFRAESVTCFAFAPDEDQEVDRIMRDMAEGRLAPGDVQELFGKVQVRRIGNSSPRFASPEAPERNFGGLRMKQILESENARCKPDLVVMPPGVKPPSGSGLLLDAWMDDQAGAICRGEWQGWPASAGFGLLREAVAAVGADDGALWLVDDVKRELRPCFNAGAHFEMFLREIRQPLSSGVISMVFFTENAVFESELARRSEYCPDVDMRIGTKTKAMIAIPVFFAQRCRGVFSAVLFEADADAHAKETFSTDDFQILFQAATLWSELMDSQLAGVGLQLNASPGL
jgi:hypothetical protein